MDWHNDTARLEALVSRERLGIITGMDGTIAPIASDNNEGQPPSAACREILHGLSQIMPLVAILSARPAADLHMLVDLPDVIYSGNRGLETWIGGRVDISPEVEEFRPMLEAAMMALYSMIDSGVQIEDAGSALMIYCESAPDADMLRTSVRKIAEDGGLRFYEASRVMEIRPPMVLDKGIGLQRLIDAHTLDGVIYLGNDLSDVDAFTVLRAQRDSGGCDGLGIGVLNEWTASDISESADLMVSGIAGAEELLDWLYRARKQWASQNRESLA